MKARKTRNRAELIGYLCAIGAGVCFGLMNFLGKIAVSDYATPLVAAAMSASFGTAMLTPVLAKGFPSALQSQTRAVVMYSLSGVAATTGSIAILFSLQRADVIIVAPLVSTAPLITIILTHLFLQRLEKITRTLLAGTALVVCGTILVVLGSSL